MKKFFLPVSVLALLIAACTNTAGVSEEISLPKSPVSINATLGLIKANKFTVSEVGTIDHWNNNAFNWDGTKSDTSKFYRDFINGQKAFTLQFKNDSAVSLYDDKKQIDGLYSLEKDTSAALLLKVRYSDTAFSFNPGEPMLMTYTYKLRGVDANSLFIETPRKLNNNTVVVLMKKR